MQDADARLRPLPYFVVACTLSGCTAEWRRIGFQIDIWLFAAPAVIATLIAVVVTLTMSARPVRSSLPLVFSMLAVGAGVLAVVVAARTISRPDVELDASELAVPIGCLLGGAITLVRALYDLRRNGERPKDLGSLSRDPRERPPNGPWTPPWLAEPRDDSKTTPNGHGGEHRRSHPDKTDRP